ncbi:hypothetical protein [Paenilisteria rocourtiae]|uniref:Uncharacterized protein n=1 Tax=Listeria rocourtiae TaxID=647910 RepID=A0A4V3DP77_9LIST|nr:hypothetical protein [Listeria rocourtiae]EUJ44823.1 hypothetical protein PROCOU_13333 [Listeria rocourtiae FSL F6-920]MBC1605534.1 hypothetical protein [Listeria rocourtiae]TDR51216.1 hypothetical protein DFP96_11447 [Listeria rocourtiae]
MSGVNIPHEEVISILGASVVTPFNVLSTEPVKVALPATAPVYTVPTKQPSFMSFSKTNISPYLPLIVFSGVDLEIDMTKSSKGYGVQVKLPDGTVQTAYSTTAVGLYEAASINMLCKKFNKNTTVSINVPSRMENW